MPFEIELVLSTGLPAAYSNQLTVTLETPVQPGVNAAPAPVFFSVANVTGCTAGDPGVGQARIPKFHDLVFAWDFGDAANATPSNAAALFMPTEWKNINIGFGMDVVHVYNDPGTYTVTCYAYETTTRRFGMVQTSVTIGDPKVVFPGGRTIIFNPGGAVNLTPYGYTGATVVTTNWAAVTSARNGNAAQTAQILIAPGVTIAQTRLVNDPSWANIRIGGLDPAVKPVIGPISDESLNIIRDFNTAKSERVLFGLNCVGGWNSPTERGRIVRPLATFNISSASYLCMQHRCNFDGWEAVPARIGTGGTADVYTVNSELTVTNWQNYGLLGGNSAVYMNGAIIACAVTQHVDALSGGGKDTGFYNNHGCFRQFSERKLYMAVCDLFSRNGWSAGGTGLDGLSVSADQACIRLNTDGADGCRANVERVAMEGMVWLEEQDSTNVDRPMNVVFDKVIQIAGPRTLNEANEVRVGGATFRNMITIIPDLPSAQSNRPGCMFRLDNSDGALTPFANDQRIQIHNCAVFDFRSYDVAFQIVSANTSGRQFTDIVEENNVVHRPNQSVPVIAQGPFNLSTPLGTRGRHKGPRFNFAMEQGTFALAVPQNGELLLPYSGIRNTRFNPAFEDPGPVTDQAFWLANPGTLHKLIITDPTINLPSGQDYTYHTASPGDLFEVRYDATGVTIINRSTRVWAVGWLWRLHLDRTHILPTFDPQFDVTGYEPPRPRPNGGPAATGGDVGLRAYDDILLFVRPNYGNADGPMQP